MNRGQKMAVSLGRKDGNRDEVASSFESYDPLRDPEMRPSPFQAFVRIQIGCDKFCTYCIVPSVRGPEQSRPPAHILAEARQLAREGCKVDHAGGGAEAMAALKVGRYDLILMDMRMPGMSGLGATRTLRADGIDTPVVALTANAFEDDRHACLAAGMNDFLVKPLAPDALRGVLTKLTRGGWTETADRAKVG